MTENPTKTMNAVDDLSISRNAEKVALVSKCVWEDHRQTLAHITGYTVFENKLPVHSKGRSQHTSGVLAHCPSIVDN
ncbi:hypothetical protein TNCV_1662021 [Trichonephila clavipes]|nr:hypothetical protein TNCV_1662021 [Trichonephila clavipes]